MAQDGGTYPHPLKRIVYFVRHGEREDLAQMEKLNPDGQDDTTKDLIKRNTLLSDFGKTQSFVTGVSIAQTLKPRIVQGAKILIMSSPYLRCLQTAFQIMMGMQYEGAMLNDPTIYYTDFLKEYQNQKTKMTKEEMATEIQRLNLPDNISITEGGDQLPFEVTSETPGLSFVRTRVFIDKLASDILEINGVKPDVVICVTHQFFMINLYFQHMQMMEAYGLIDYCSFGRLLIDRKGHTKVDIVNHHQHLDKLSFFHQKL